jgi:flagellar biosynthesis/type III secretory pathway protein FliH
MGIEEMVLERAKKEGLEDGMEKGIEKGIQKGKAEVVSNLIIKMGMTDAQAADIAGVSVDFVKKVRKKLKIAQGISQSSQSIIYYTASYPVLI